MRDGVVQDGDAGQVGQNHIIAGGEMFKTDNFSVIDRVPTPYDIAQMVRYWDKAGTEGGGAYTVGVKMCKLTNGKFVVLDVKRGQWSSEKRERIMKQCAEADGQACKVYVEQEPGSGGKESAEATVKNLAGFAVYKDRPTGDKVFRADPYSVQVNEGNVTLLHGAWNDDYVSELKDFPFSKYKDQTDGSSGAFAKVIGWKKIKVSTR